MCACLFRPYTNFQLAVGVDAGVVIWDLETANNIKPGASQSMLLSAKGHAPVTNVEYSHSVRLAQIIHHTIVRYQLFLIPFVTIACFFQGLLLLSCSSYDTTIYVWDVSTWNRSPLYRLGGGGVPFVSWSPSDDKILSTSPKTIFRFVIFLFLRTIWT